MFKNIGKKIKTLASVICWLGIVLFLIAGIVLIVIGFAEEVFELCIIAVPVIIVGPLACWIGSFFMYGFGQLVDNTDILVRQTNNNPTNVAAYATVQQPVQQPAQQQTQWYCGGCGNVISQNPCPHCGKVN